MKLVDLKNNTHTDSGKEIIDKDHKFKVSDRVRISKYKNNFTKVYTLNWSEKVFVIKRIKNTMPLIYVVSGLNGEKSVGTFCEKELQKTNQDRNDNQEKKR